MYVVTKKEIKGFHLHEKYVSLKKEENCSPQKNQFHCYLLHRGFHRVV